MKYVFLSLIFIVVCNGQMIGSSTGPSLMPPSFEVRSVDDQIQAARVHHEQGDYEKAISILKKLGSRTQHQGVIDEYLADAYLAQREFVLAKEFYKKSYAYYLQTKDEAGAKRVLSVMNYLGASEIQ